MSIPGGVALVAEPVAESLNAEGDPALGEEKGQSVGWQNLGKRRQDGHIDAPTGLRLLKNDPAILEVLAPQFDDIGAPAGREEEQTKRQMLTAVLRPPCAEPAEVLDGPGGKAAFPFRPQTLHLSDRVLGDLSHAGAPSIERREGLTKLLARLGVRARLSRQRRTSATVSDAAGVSGA